MENLQQLQARVGHPFQLAVPPPPPAQQPTAGGSGSKKSGPLHVRMGSGSIASNDSNLVSLLGGASRIAVLCVEIYSHCTVDVEHVNRLRLARTRTRRPS